MRRRMNPNRERCQSVIFECEDMKIPFQLISFMDKSLHDYITMGLSFAALDINKEGKRGASLWRRHFSCKTKPKRNVNIHKDIISKEDIEKITISIHNEGTVVVANIQLTDDKAINKKWFGKALKQLALHQVMYNFEMI